MAILTLLLCVPGAHAEDSGSKLSRFRGAVSKAKQKVGTLNTVKDFAKKMGAIKSVKAVPNKNKQLAVNIARAKASHMSLNK